MAEEKERVLEVEEEEEVGSRVLPWKSPHLIGALGTHPSSLFGKRLVLLSDSATESVCSFYFNSFSPTIHN